MKLRASLLLTTLALLLCHSVSSFAQEKGEMDWLTRWTDKLGNIFNTSFDVGLQSSFVNTRGMLGEDSQSQLFRFDGYGVQGAIHFFPKSKSTIGLFASYAQMANSTAYNTMVVPEAVSTQLGIVFSYQVQSTPKRKVYWIQEIGASQMNLAYGSESLDRDRVKRWGLGVQEAVKYHHAFSEQFGITLKAYINLSAYWGKVRVYAPLKPTHSVELGVAFSISVL